MQADVRRFIGSQVGDDELERVVIRTFETMEKASEGNHLLFTPFLEPEIQSVIVSLHKKYHPELTLVTSGGFNDADRVVFGFDPWPVEGQEPEFPIVMFKAESLNHRFKPTHRDVLGSLMGLGIKRERIGDIRIKNDSVYVAVSTDMSLWLEQQWLKIGSCDISLYRILISQAQDIEEAGEGIQVTVKSLRLDAVIAEGFNMARDKAATLVQNGRCKLNHKEVTSKSEEIHEKDLISVRGFGRLRVKELGGQTKKDRIWLMLERFR